MADDSASPPNEGGNTLLGIAKAKVMSVARDYYRTATDLITGMDQDCFAQGYETGYVHGYDEAYRKAYARGIVHGRREAESDTDTSDESDNSEESSEQDDSPKHDDGLKGNDKSVKDGLCCSSIFLPGPNGEPVRPFYRVLVQQTPSGQGPKLVPYEEDMIDLFYDAKSHISSGNDGEDEASSSSETDEASLTGDITPSAAAGAADNADHSLEAWFDALSRPSTPINEAATINTAISPGIVTAHDDGPNNGFNSTAEGTLIDVSTKGKPQASAAVSVGNNSTSEGVLIDVSAEDAASASVPDPVGSRPDSPVVYIDLDTYLARGPLPSEPSCVSGNSASESVLIDISEDPAHVAASAPSHSDLNSANLALASAGRGNVNLIDDTPLGTAEHSSSATASLISVDTLMDNSGENSSRVSSGNDTNTNANPGVANAAHGADGSATMPERFVLTLAPAPATATATAIRPPFPWVVRPPSAATIPAFAPVPGLPDFESGIGTTPSGVTIPIPLTILYAVPTPHTITPIPPSPEAMLDPAHARLNRSGGRPAYPVFENTGNNNTGNPVNRTGHGRGTGSGIGVGVGRGGFGTFHNGGFGHGGFGRGGGSGLGRGFGHGGGGTATDNDNDSGASLGENPWRVLIGPLSPAAQAAWRVDGGKRYLRAKLHDAAAAAEAAEAATAAAAGPTSSTLFAAAAAGRAGYGARAGAGAGAGHGGRGGYHARNTNNNWGGLHRGGRRRTSQGSDGDKSGLMLCDMIRDKAGQWYVRALFSSPAKAQDALRFFEGGYQCGGSIMWAWLYRDEE